MTAFPGAPAGFVRRDVAGAALYADPADLDALVRAGLDGPAAWPRSGGIAPGSGRGPVAVVETAAGRLFLKMLRRGGALARLRGERFRGHRRLLDNLTLPAAARRLGVPTPRVVALRLEAAGGACWRGYLASEHLDGARSLA